MSPGTKLRIGEVIVDLTLGELDRAGVRERLPDQAAEVLAALIEHPGELVTREALSARLWPRTTYSDTDAGLNTAVKKLRAALRDDADHPRYIETVPRRGYRLIASVEPLLAVPEASGSAATEDAPNIVARKHTHRSRSLMLGAVIALAAIAALAAYWVRDHRGTTTQRVSASSELPQRTVAVLPFLNLTGDARQDYLALGLAENVLHELAQLRGINVIARTSSFAVDAEHIDVREVGDKLNAGYVVEGSVQVVHAQMQVTTQLIDASTGEHVWSKRFDSTLEDVFDVQQQIAAAIAETLQLSAGRAPGEVFVRSGTQSPDAWLACERGRSLVATRNYAKIVAGIGELERAVQLDPRFTTAFIELSQAFVLQTQYAPAASADEIHAARDLAIGAAMAAANQALAIDRTLGDALIARGMAQGYMDRRDQAERDMRAGLALSPSSARGHQVLGELLIERGRNIQEGLALLERASLLDPLEPRGPYYRGFTELRRGHADEAEQLLLEALRRQPNYAPALTRLSTLYWILHGEFSTAVKFGELAFQADPDTEFVRGHLADAYLELGEIAAADGLTSTGVDPATTRASAVDLRNGAIELAAAKVRAFPERFVPCDYVSHSYAILAEAERTRDFSGARRFLEKVVEIDLRGEPRIRPGSEFSATILAQLMALAGDDVGARALLEKVLAQTQDYRGSMLPSCGNANRTRARALALLGRDSEAAQHLSRAVLQENAWYFGWYLFEVDSAFARLRGSAAFESLRAAYRQRVAAEQAKLALLRDDGLVPARP